MLPLNQLSSVNIPTYLIGSRNKDVSRLKDYEDGGIDLNDATQGLMYQGWESELQDDTVVLRSDNGYSYTIYSGTDITEISFTFDQNMRPVLAFVEGGIPKLQWFDSNIGTMTVTTLASGILNPRVFLDDKRYLHNSSSDIILGYLRVGNLYYRQQRDRFLIEYLLASNVYTMGTGAQSHTLVKIGMGKNSRLHFVLGS